MGESSSQYEDIFWQDKARVIKRGGSAPIKQAECSADTRSDLQDSGLLGEPPHLMAKSKANAGRAGDGPWTGNWIGDATCWFNQHEADEPMPSQRPCRARSEGKVAEEFSNTA